MTLTDRIREAVKVPFETSDHGLLISLHQEAFSLRGLCMKCPSRFADAYHMLKSYLNKTDMAKKKAEESAPIESKYTIKKEYEDINFQVMDWGLLSKDTVTDAMAEYVIKNIPSLKDIFEKKD